jgi:hypothetical protein
MEVDLATTTPTMYLLQSLSTVAWMDASEVRLLAKRQSLD